MGCSGAIRFRTGDANGGGAGGISFAVGNSGSGSGGEILLKAGDAPNGAGGSARLAAGTGGLEVEGTDSPVVAFSCPSPIPPPLSP